MFVCLTATKTPDRDGVWRTMRADIASTAAECFPVDCQPLYHALLVALFDGGCEVFVSSSAERTWHFALGYTQPGCLYVVDYEMAGRELAAKIATAAYSYCVMIANRETMRQLERYPNGMTIDKDMPTEAVTRHILTLVAQGCDTVRRQDRHLCSLIECHPPRRNPMKVESWVAEALESCFVHVSSEDVFPPLTDQDDDAQSRELEQLRSWDFTALELERDALLRLVWRVFADFDLLRQLDVDPQTFQTFLLAVHANYFDNPYHNFYHVVDVLQCCYYLLRCRVSHLCASLGAECIFALFIACLCHDLGHPSFGNSFLKEASHPLAILFNDTSVLENYHSLVLFSILRQPQYDWTRTWTTSRRRHFRHCVISCILGTDMSNHFDFIRRFDATFPSLDATGVPSDGSALSEEQRLQLCLALIKCSDISNVIRPFRVARRWGVALLNEFLLQGDYEKVLGQPVGPLNDRDTLKTGDGQYRFLTAVAAPLYRSVGAKVHGLECFEGLIQENAANWTSFRDESVSFDP